VLQHITKKSYNLEFETVGVPNGEKNYVGDGLTKPAVRPYAWYLTRGEKKNQRSPVICCDSVRIGQERGAEPLTAIREEPRDAS
jgi:hypothetical protein